MCSPVIHLPFSVHAGSIFFLRLKEFYKTPSAAINTTQPQLAPTAFSGEGSFKTQANYIHQPTPCLTKKETDNKNKKQNTIFKNAEAFIFLFLSLTHVDSKKHCKQCLCIQG